MGKRDLLQIFKVLFVVRARPLYTLRIQSFLLFFPSSSEFPALRTRCKRQFGNSRVAKDSLETRELQKIVWKLERWYSPCYQVSPRYVLLGLFCLYIRSLLPIQQVSLQGPGITKVCVTRCETRTLRYVNTRQLFFFGAKDTLETREMVLARPLYTEYIQVYTEVCIEDLDTSWFWSGPWCLNPKT